MPDLANILSEWEPVAGWSAVLLLLLAVLILARKCAVLERRVQKLERRMDAQFF